MVHRYMVLISCSFLLVFLTLHVGVFLLSIPSTTSVVCNDKFILKKDESMSIGAYESVENPTSFGGMV